MQRVKQVKAIELKHYPVFYKALGTNWDGMGGKYCFHLGFNENCEDFDPSGIAHSGGIYFTDIDNIGTWASSMRPMIAVVSLEPDEIVYCDGRDGVYKANGIFIDRVYDINDLAYDPVGLAIVQKNPLNIELFKNPSPELLSLAGLPV